MERFDARSVLTNLPYLASLVCLALHTISWQLTLRRFPLTVAYGSLSLVYVTTLALSVLVFHEPATAIHGVGAALIAGGVYLLGTGRSNAIG